MRRLDPGHKALRDFGHELLAPRRQRSQKLRLATVLPLLD